MDEALKSPVKLELRLVSELTPALDALLWPEIALETLEAVLLETIDPLVLLEKLSARRDVAVRELERPLEAVLGMLEVALEALEAALDELTVVTWLEALLKMELEAALKTLLELPAETLEIPLAPLGTLPEAVETAIELEPFDKVLLDALFWLEIALDAPAVALKPLELYPDVDIETELKP
ncbi:hypothetical protein KL925_003961 [Ogataea polymorpha]|nr:hypothetical protein KL925_003961 [Ogataea polymorpha]KAG7932701.1 hypothetical protein KL934_003356 [Ogataea polymorpha]